MRPKCINNQREDLRRLEVPDTMAEDNVVVGRSGVVLQVVYWEFIVEGYARTDRGLRDVRLGLGEGEW